MVKIKIPKSSRFKKLLTISLLQIAAIFVAACCVITYVAHNGLSKGRWGFFIFVCVVSLLYAVSVPVLFVKKVPRTYPSWNWNIMLSIPAIALAITLLAASISITVHIEHGCLEFCALVTVAAVIAFFSTLLFLLECLVLFRKAIKDEKSRREDAIVNHMQTQTDTEIMSTSQL